jgi:hypothetical protein
MRTLGPKAVAKIQRLSSMMTSIFRTPGTPLRFWDGKLDVKYPAGHPDAGKPVIDEETGEVKTRETSNLDIAVPKDLYLEIEELLKKDDNGKSKLSGTGQYITCNDHLVAVSARVDSAKGLFIIQVSEPNQGSWLTAGSDEFNAEYERRFGKKAKSVSDAKAKAPDVKVDDDDWED